MNEIFYLQPPEMHSSFPKQLLVTRYRVLYHPLWNLSVRENSLDTTYSTPAPARTRPGSLASS